MTQHAILYRTERDNRLILMWNGGGIFVEFEKKDEPVSLMDLAAYCTPRDGITHLWIHPSADMVVLSGKWVEEVMQQEGYDCLYNWDDDENLVSLHGYRKHDKGRSQRFNIIFLEYSLWGWQDLEVAQVMRLIDNLELALGVPIGGSPAGVGMRFLEKTTALHKHWLVKSSADLSTIPWQEASRPLVWERFPTREELDSKYLYAFDKNSAYGRAAWEECFGVGDPVYFGEGEIATFDPHTPGIWRVVLEPPYAYEYNPDLMPPECWTLNGWLCTPVLKMLRKSGWTIEVHEAWIFPKKARLFRGWVENLWGFRSESTGVEREAYKSVMNDTLGLTRSSKLGTDSWKYRPDINTTVVGGAYAVMYYNLVRYAMRDCYPIMVQLDAVYYASSDPLPNVAVPGILDHSESLGGYKLKWRLPMDITINVEGSHMTVRAILASSMPQVKKLKYFNLLALHLGQ